MYFDRRGGNPYERLSAIGGPVDAGESVSTAGGTDLPAEFETRAAGDALVWKGLFTVRSRDRSPDPRESTHCEAPRVDATRGK